MKGVSTPLGEIPDLVVFDLCCYFYVKCLLPSFKNGVLREMGQVIFFAEKIVNNW